ncbi:MAG: hypothetical protein GXX08_13275 [Firmicutes bacterium]|nr:hypothetical protein [Bacillota bacterium]
MKRAALRFAKLFRKELESQKVLVFFIAAAVVVWDVFLWTKSARWQPELILTLTFLPIMLIVFWSFLATVLRLRQEWEGNHLHLILGLPVRGWYVTGSKAFATLVEIAALTILVAVCTAIVSRTEFFLQLNVGAAYSAADLAHMVLQVLIAFWLSLSIVITLVQFACISGRMYERFSGLISVWVLVLSVWVGVRFGALFEPALRWLPDFKLKSVRMINDYVSFETVMVSSAPLASALLWALILFVAGSWLLERQVEI